MVIKKKQMHELVLKKLKRIILSGKYKPGDFLPSQVELAKQIGTTRSALRGAMLILAEMGIVESTAGKGTVLKTVTFPDNNISILYDVY
ncbi:MAG: GntR family transcriptional regulator [Desulfitobacteriaceae bacterium]|nr:GntR family transcriptional regulator [Desulfitobacteriaceae bacterium]MDD4402777.1 GntR family transcriptional regulator [Desulfitobacteriaceae bacterium]